jgi:hypothetical protein
MLRIPVKNRSKTGPLNDPTLSPSDGERVAEGRVRGRRTAWRCKWFWWCWSRCDRPGAERSVRRRNFRKPCAHAIASHHWGPTRRSATSSTRPDLFTSIAVEKHALTNAATGRRGNGPQWLPPATPPATIARDSPLAGCSTPRRPAAHRPLRRCYAVSHGRA